MDIFSLLFQDVELKRGAKDDPREMEKIRRQQVDKNFANWLSAYTVYIGVVLQVQPEHGPALAKYLDLIHRAYRECAGAAWLRYDEMFRTCAAMGSSLPWDREHHQLWSQCMGPSIRISGHLKSVRGLEGIVWQKIVKELLEGSITGPLCPPICPSIGPLCALCTFPLWA